MPSLGNIKPLFCYGGNILASSYKGLYLSIDKGKSWSVADSSYGMKVIKK
jgi:hypothetical protein